MSADPPALTGDWPGVVTRRWIVTVCAMTATLMQALDATIANVALPYMQGGLSATSDQVIWVLTSYIVAAAIMTPPVGWLSARFGIRTLLITSLVGFTAASMLCGTANSLGEMVLFRVIQGAFGASLVPLSQSIMLDLYPPEKRGEALAIWGIGVMVGPILGPTLGGYLTEIYNWRWVFFVNLPFGVLATVGLFLFFRDGAPRRIGRFDWIGFTALGVGVGALQLMLDRGELKDWFGSMEIVTEAVLTGVGIYLFTIQTLTSRKPLLAARLFTDINFVSGCVIGFVLFMVLFATNALLAPYLQTLADYPVEKAGLLMAPRGLGTMAAMLIAGRMIGRLDARLLMGAGLLLVAASLWVMTGWTPDVSQFDIVTNALMQGFGIGLAFIPVSVVAFATLPPELRTDGTSFFNLIRNIGGAIGISITSFLLVRNTQIVHAQLVERVNPLNRMLQSGGAFEHWNIANPATLAALNAEITRQATIVGYIDNFTVMMLVCLPVVLLLFLMRKPGPGTDPAPAVGD